MESSNTPKFYFKTVENSEVYNNHAQKRQQEIKKGVDQIKQSHFDPKIVPMNIGQLSKQSHGCRDLNSDYG